eukprot:jgi/Tetstr1/430731/TSEL_020522.t1
MEANVAHLPVGGEVVAARIMHSVSASGSVDKKSATPARRKGSWSTSSASSSCFVYRRRSRKPGSTSGTSSSPQTSSKDIFRRKACCL